MKNYFVVEIKLCIETDVEMHPPLNPQHLIDSVGERLLVAAKENGYICSGAKLTVSRPKKPPKGMDGQEHA